MSLDNDQVASKGLAQLLDAERSCDAHAKALALVKIEVDRRQSLFHGTSHAEYLKAARQLESDHQRSAQRLHDLTASLGFQDLKQPINANDKYTRYLRLYIQARTMKHSILQRLTRIQDELNPLRDTQSRTGGRRVRKVGTSNIHTTSSLPDTWKLTLTGPLT